MSSSYRRYLFLGSALALINALDLIKDDGDHFGTKEQEAGHRTYWTAFVLDFLLSMRLGRVPIMGGSASSTVAHPDEFGSEEYELWSPLPLGVTNRLDDAKSRRSRPDCAALRLLPRVDHHSTSAGAVMRSCALSTFGQTIRLCCIGVHVLEFANTGQGADATLRQNLLAQELREWEQTLPPHLILARDFSNVARDTISPTHIFDLHLLNQTLILILCRNGCVQTWKINSV